MYTWNIYINKYNVCIYIIYIYNLYITLYNLHIIYA